MIFFEKFLSVDEIPIAMNCMYAMMYDDNDKAGHVYTKVCERINYVLVENKLFEKHILFLKKHGYLDNLTNIDKKLCMDLYRNWFRNLESNEKEKELRKIIDSYNQM